LEGEEAFKIQTSVIDQNRNVWYSNTHLNVLKTNLQRLIDMFIALILSMAGIFKRIVNRKKKKKKKKK